MSRNIIFVEINIVTDLINGLPGNSSVNTVQHATVDEAVFSMYSALSSGGKRGYASRFKATAR
jgi:hypothetical protein